MSRTTKWKPEKAKVKVVFRLQFHATNIPQSGWEKLFISFIPTESGKFIAKTSKANVRNGTCKWADPIYETTRLPLDSRNKRYDDKLYKLVVGMGTSRSSILGEATINLADYADASNPSVIALPLHGCDHGTILHVTVQLLTAKTGFREFEQQFDRGLQSSSNLKREVEPSNATSSSSESQISDDHGNKVNTKTHYGSESKELISVVEETCIHEEFSDSPVGCDGSSNASENYYADKHNSSSIHELDSLRSMVSGDLNGPGCSQSTPIEKADRSDHQGWSSDYSMDNDLAIAHEENHRLRGSLEMAESSFFELKLELSALHSHANEMGTETQKIAQQLTTEIYSGQKLEREIMVLRSECSKFKDELEQLKEVKASSKFIVRTQDQTDLHQLTWVNGLLLVEDRIRELQEKIHIGFHESDLSFAHLDLEVLLSIVQDLEKGTVAALPLQHKVQEPGSTRAFDLGEGKSSELLIQLDEAKVERENLIRKMDEMECYYEALVQELEENQKRILGEFQSLRYEHSTCSYTISTCKAETELIRHDMNSQLLRSAEERHALACVNEELVKRVTTAEALVQELEENQQRILGEFQSLRNEHSTCADTISTCKAETESIYHDMNDQILKFSKERHALGCVNEELEKRVTTAESALKRARLNYSIAVTQLQKDLDMLSSQVFSMFETNQNLIEETFSESSKPFSQRYPNIVENLQKSDDTLVLREKKLLGVDVLSDDDLSDICCANLYLDVYSGTLQETLFEASTDANKMKEQINEYAQKLELSNQSRDFLFGRLQTAVEDVHAHNEQIAQINDVKLQNRKLEASSESVSRENFLLMEKITECETLLMDYRVYKCKYEVASAEKLELENLLEVKGLDSVNLRKDLSIVKEELETLKAGFRELEMSKENMQKLLGFLQEKFGSLLASCHKQFGGQFSFRNSLCQNTVFRDITGVIMKLEEVHNYTDEKIKELEKERNIARSEFDDMRTKFKHDIHDMVAKLDMLTAFVEKLQLQLESVCKKFKNSLGVGECNAQHTEGLLMYLASLELELHKISSNDRNSVEEILGSDTLANEFRRSKLTFSEINQEKQDFLISVENKEETIIREELELEIIRLVLKAKLDEYFDELLMLRDDYSELTNKLSEQILKTKEFKNLANELKDRVHVAREKREPEGPSESLRIAFMKEQYETTVQELKQQLSVSKRHGENMLFKLQDALDETESRKKSEASYLKRIEELSFKIVGLEAELQSIQAELECALLNLECCKEEKEKIVASMQECEEEKSKVAFELSLFQEKLAQKEEKGVVNKERHMGIDSLMTVNASTSPIEKAGHAAQIIELEGMKSEKSVLSIMSSGSGFQDLQRELVQLHKANEELGGIYPNFKDFPGEGNAVERVLALEIELAEALTAKKKSSIQFQSSFLKQHSDKEAVFKSFRDINELIKDTLEIKSKYVNVETELKEMHERYSQLSLQFAEVEGERQKLVMTLKNVRSSRNLVHMNCSSSENLDGNLL